MPVMTTVMNLRTQEELTYGLLPEEAVIAAWERERGNMNTWEYARSDAPVVTGDRTVAAGDWCAMLLAN